VTNVITGTIAPLETQSGPFSVSSTGNVDMSLVSLVRADSAKTTLNTAVTFGIGQQLESECRPIRTVSMAPSLTTQLSTLVKTGDYCVVLTDTGTLPAAANFAVRVVHP
jgi:hypothetical protein